MNYIEWHGMRDVFTIGSFSLRWYGVLFAAGLMLGYLIMSWMRARETDQSEYAKSLDLDILLIVLVAGTVVGARLYHVFFYQWSYYQNHIGEIFLVWKGGLASHGGAIGILLILWLYTKKTGISMLWLLDRLAIPILLASAFIRFGNFMNSEILGTQTTVPWAVIFKAEHAKYAGFVPRHPAQLYEAFAYFVLFIGLLLTYIKTRLSVRTGALFGIMLSGIFISRFFIEFVKMRQEELTAGQSVSMLNVGQWSSIPFVIAGVTLIIFSYRSKTE